MTASPVRGKVFAVHYGRAKSVGNAAKALPHKHVFAKNC